MESSARVEWVRDGRAHLACDSDGTCGSCATSAGCPLRRRGRTGLPGIEVPDRAEDTRPLQAGERVTVEVADLDLLRAVACAYLPPLGGVLVAPMLAGAFGGSEGAMLFAATGGAAAGWWLARAALRRRPPKVVVRHRREADGEA